VNREFDPERLRAAGAIVVGLGSLGSPVALYLAAAGVGRIGVVDPAVVEPEDLDRQPLHFTPDLGVPKAQNAAVKLRALNPEVHVEPYPARLDELNGEAIVMGADVVVDCVGSALVSDACCAAGVPFVTASVSGLRGEVLSVRPGESACRRCAAMEEATGRAPGALAGVVGSIQALEALKLLTGVGRPLLDTVLRIDAATMEQRRVPAARRDGCESCDRVPAPAGAA
jgi:molybdopterin/thiamine biosynthesis adenylyltransferase